MSRDSDSAELIVVGILADLSGRHVLVQGIQPNPFTPVPSYPARHNCPRSIVELAVTGGYEVTMCYS